MSRRRAPPTRVARCSALLIGRWWLWLVATVLPIGAALAIGLREPTSNAAPRRFQVGVRDVYHVETINASVFDLGEMFGEDETVAAPATPGGLAPQSFQGEVRVDLHVIVLEAQADRASVLFQIRRPVVRMEADGLITAGAITQLESELLRDVYANLDGQGRIRGLRFGPNTSHLTRNCVRSLVALTQVVLPPESSAEPWEVEECDLNGPHRVRYEPVLVGPGTTFTKTKQHYLSDKGNSPSADELATTIAPSGQLHIHFDSAAGRLQTLAGTDVYAVMVNGRTVVRSETTAQIRHVGAEVLSESQLAHLRDRAAQRATVAALQSLARNEATEELELAQQRAWLGDATAESILAELARLESVPEAERELTSVFLKAKALVMLDSSSSARLGERLIDAPPSGPTILVLVGALMEVGSPEAQAAMVRAFACGVATGRLWRSWRRRWAPSTHRPPRLNRCFGTWPVTQAMTTFVRRPSWRWEAWRGG